jgi:hypothetical protein
MPARSIIAYITLIPKLKDLRPIRLVNRLYKIIAKDLSIRFLKVMHAIISNKQSAIKAGRHILFYF